MAAVLLPNAPTPETESSSHLFLAACFVVRAEGSLVRQTGHFDCAWARRRL